MARDISPDEARDEQLAELTDKHYEALRTKLQGGDPDTMASIGDALAVELTDEVVNEMARQSTFGALLVGDQIKRLVDKALLARAEVAALREVKQLEQQREKSQDEARIDRAVMDRAH